MLLGCLAAGGWGLRHARFFDHGQVPARAENKTLVIRQGGTYSGTFRSLDSQVPCVRIATTEPVTLRGCLLQGAGHLIEATGGGARLTVLHCRGYGLLPSRDQTPRGRFLEVNSAQSVRVEHNYLEGTTGINVYEWNGDGSPDQTLTVRFNRCRNIDGRLRNGGVEAANFLGLNGVHRLENIEVAWNEVRNEPDKSLVEDNINFFNSGGTPRSPARIHDNYIQGAYPFPATANGYTGTGICLDGDGRSPLAATAFVHCYDNSVVSTCGAAMNIAAGHDNQFYNNRMVSSGMLPDGTRLQANWAATGVWNAYKQPESVFFNNSIRQNIIGYYSKGGTLPFPDRQDLSPGHCTSCTGTQHLPNPITLATEREEWRRWQEKLRRAGIRVGLGLARTTRPDNAGAHALSP
ncbi:MAG: hypothetical protein NVS3B25_08060 [Hymenobacter sp.]